MPTEEIDWGWEEAFSKFGFEDGDGWNGTDLVAAFLEEQGYETDCDTWGIHNYMIMDVKRAGASIIPDGVVVGYDDPRTWIPKTLQEKLDEEFRGQCFTILWSGVSLYYSAMPRRRLRKEKELSRQVKKEDRDYTKQISIMFSNSPDGEENEDMKEFDRCLDMLEDELGFRVSRNQFVLYLLKHYRETKGIE